MYQFFNPAAIDGVVYQGSNINIHRSANIEGFCGGLNSGRVLVDFSVGNCYQYGNADAFTSRNSVSRIIIEEVEPPVAWAETTEHKYKQH